MALRAPLIFDSNGHHILSTHFVVICGCCCLSLISFSILSAKIHVSFMDAVHVFIKFVFSGYEILSLFSFLTLGLT